LTLCYALEEKFKKMPFHEFSREYTRELEDITPVIQTTYLSTTSIIAVNLYGNYEVVMN
jgi:hypothetical protein